MQPRTIQQWFEQLPEPIRTQALNNTAETLKNLVTPTLNLALFRGFEWDKTKQKYLYWASIHSRAAAGEFNTK